ncbi:MAG: acyltransferase family protein [Ruminococcus sp.]|nr:acyltransferase family protein [Ruminococcus sp.]
MKQLSNKKRQIEFDVMRVVAMFAVIVTHACGAVVHDASVESGEFILLTVISAAITWDVPIFVMISGRFFLDPDKQISIKDIFKKYIKHIAIAFCIWSAIYTAFYVWDAWKLGENIISMWKQFIFQFLTGPYHMWYVFMIIGLYIATPILRKITQEKRLMEYFILLFLVSQFIVQYATKFPIIGETLSEIFDKTYFHIALGYCGYYVLGYYLYKFGIPTKFETPLYIVSCIMIIFSCIGTTVQSIYDGEVNAFLSTYQTPNVIIESCGIYLLFIKKFSKKKLKDKTEKIFSKLGKWGFGIYLSHALVLEFLELVGITPMIAFPLGVLIMSICTFVISAFLTYVIEKIPVLNRYMI